MIELNEIKVKEKPIYVEPIKKKKNKTSLLIPITLILIGIILMLSAIIIKDKRVREQQTEIDRLQNKVYQDIELIDSLKQVY